MSHFTRYSRGLRILTLLLVLGYGTFTIWNLHNRGLFEYVGIDYRLWYSSGVIARSHGFASVYDADLQTQYQQPLYDQYALPSQFSMPFWALPLPYLAAFVAPMMLLTLFSPVTGFLLLTSFNMLGSMVYLSWFMRRNGGILRRDTSVLAALALPFVLNALSGALNLWLLITLGEFITALRRGRDYQAGVWLAGLLLKPQTLLLLVPGLILSRRHKALMGLVLGTLIVVGSSVLLAGPAAIAGPLTAVREWPAALAESGMNYRAFSINMDRFVAHGFSNPLAMISAAVTLAAALWLWLPGEDLWASHHLDAAVLATYAATCSVSPHRNVHMAIPMLALGLAMHEKGIVPPRLALAWVTVPTVLFLLASLRSVSIAHAAGGMSVLGMNLAVLIWAVHDKSRALCASSAP